MQFKKEKNYIYNNKQINYNYKRKKCLRRFS